jgi:hypothetical protein
MFGKGPVILKLLKKYGSVTTETLSVDIVKDVAAVFDRKVDTKIAEDVIGIIKADDEDNLVEWLSDPENVNRLKELAGPVQNATDLVECPECSELSTVRQGEIAPVNPHIVCKVCGFVIHLD